MVPVCSSQRVAAFDHHPVQRTRALRCGGTDRYGQSPPAGTRLDDGEGIRASESAPQRIETSSDNGPEQRSDLGTGDEVAPSTPGTAAGGEEAAPGSVERQFDEAIEAKLPVALQRLRDRGQDHLPRAVAPKSVTLLSNCGRMPNTRVRTRVTPTANVSELGVRTGVVSAPSGTSSNHIARATFR